MLYQRPSSTLHTLLALGRVSNLPTVWSNCLAGWWLGGGGSRTNLILLCLGATFLYLGGTFLNDAFDVDFDKAKRFTRPIPSGRISINEVWRWGLGWLILGCCCLIWINTITAILAIVLSLVILFYDAVHKQTIFAPLIMAGCRFLLYLLAASVAAAGIAGTAIWSAVALGSYILGLSCLAVKETIPSHVKPWPTVLLAAPVFLTILRDNQEWLVTGLLLAAILMTWIIGAVWHTFWGPHRNVGFSVSRLLAGIALVDLLAVADFSQPAIWFFPFCFLASLFLQRFVPAT